MSQVPIEEPDKHVSERESERERKREKEKARETVRHNKKKSTPAKKNIMTEKTKKMPY